MKLTYNIQNVNVEQLIEEIKSIANINLYQDGYITTNGDEVEINLNSTPSQEVIDNITLVCNNHVNDINYKYNKSFKINNSLEDPSNIDYDIMGFNKRRTVVFGELIKVEYFKSYDPNTSTYSDLVVEENRQFTRNSDGLALSRLLTSKWYTNNGEVGLTKSYTKYYSLEESIQEGITRRTNVIDATKVYTLGVLGRDYSFDLLSSVKAEVSIYIDGYTVPLRNAIQASTKPYLNQTIKDAIIEKLRLS